MKTENNNGTTEAEAVALSQLVSRLPNPFEAEPCCNGGWAISCGQQHICFCGSDGQRDMLLAALNYWRGTPNEIEVMNRLLDFPANTKDRHFLPRKNIGASDC